MSTETGTGGFRTLVALIVAMAAFCLLLPGSALAQESTDPAISEHQATFPVIEPPEAPFTAHQSMLRFSPGAGAPLHQHGGPGYITILEGQVTLYENGEEKLYSAGESFVETPDNEYWAVNSADQDMILMVTYLVPEGHEVTTTIDSPDAPETPDAGPETLAERTYEFVDPPESFQLIHTVRSFDPGAVSDADTADGDLLQTTVDGTLSATVGDETETLERGSAVLVQAGLEYVFTNDGDAQAITMSTELAPDAYSMVPDAGTIVDRTMATWLIVMAAAGMLIVGGVLRVSSIRFR